MDRNRGIALLLLAVTLGTVAWLAFTGLTERRAAVDLADDAPRTTATVIDRFSSRQAGGNSQVTVRFTVDGAPQRATLDTPRPQDVPSQVRIAYDLDDPTIAVFADEDAALATGAGRGNLTLIVLLAIVAAGLGAYLVLPGFRAFVHRN